ncbi:phytoene/squalene synthase family protein [Sphingobium sufflavum]|uniref:phytoene/squalene synthase family protein n=1 Tax=Sphingobium sufflavum TaxID=1129547 RepID=UPI001F33DDD3|nr:phytoene/squalene synthase family protein [Sphingobium sufflavum]MCE7794992.1 phytoene/squalene synthase family protein [Sphingobium sufflavum]
MASRDALVAHARASIARGSKSFAAASRLFDPVMRERVWLLYAWCRACDDIVDGQDHGGAMTSVADLDARLSRIERLTDGALAGQQTGEAAFDCLALVARECALPHRYVHDLLEGFALDAEGWRPETLNDLLAYCYHVAGAVGCLMAIVMGVEPDDDAVIDRACDLGLAFQLANVARDVAEDAAAGRCYLPRDWLREMGLDEGALSDPVARPGLAILTGRLAALAARYEASARVGTPALSYRAAWAVLAAAGIYGGIARKVGAAGQGALDRRMTTGTGEKLGWLVRSAGQGAVRARLYPLHPRDPALWRRPQSWSACRSTE